MARSTDARRPDLARVVLHSDDTITIWMVLAWFKGKQQAHYRKWFLHAGTDGQPGFTASDDCWQKYGLHGCLDYDQAVACYDAMRRRKLDLPCYWALMSVTIVQQSRIVKCTTRDPLAKRVRKQDG